MAGHHRTDLADHEGKFFEVLHTTPRSQLAVMTIAPGEEAGPPETHEEQDQVIVVLKGEMLARVWDEGEDAQPVEVHGGAGTAAPARRRRHGGAGTALVVHAGTQHHVASVGEEPLSFVTVYGPPAY